MYSNIDVHIFFRVLTGMNLTTTGIGAMVLVVTICVSTSMAVVVVKRKGLNCWGKSKYMFTNYLDQYVFISSHYMQDVIDEMIFYQTVPGPRMSKKNKVV